MHPAGAKELAQAMLKEDITIESEICNGANNRLFKCHTSDAIYALKLYSNNDRRDRRLAELRALEFFEYTNILATPRLIATNEEANCSILSWVNGNPHVKNLSQESVQQFTQFQLEIATQSVYADKFKFDLASEACISAEAIIRQVNKRVKKLTALTPKEEGLKQFLKKFLHLKQVAFEFSRSLLEHHDMTVETVLPRDKQILIPSDMGAHNAIVDKDNQNIHFIDFEYFGWDDPVTSICNFNLHPAHQISSQGQDYFKTNLIDACKPNDPLIEIRYKALLPLFYLRWSVIILGLFLSDKKMQNSVHSSQVDEEQKLRQEKLELATSYLNQLDLVLQQ